MQLFRAQCSSQGTEDYWIKQSILVQLDIKLTSRMKQTHGLQLQIKTQRCIYQIQTEWYTLRYPSCERERDGMRVVGKGFVEIPCSEPLTVYGETRL